MPTVENKNDNEAQRADYNPAKECGGALQAPPVHGAKLQPTFILVHFEFHRRPPVKMIMKTFCLKIPIPS